MAKDAVSASILKSNLELLKKEGQELLNLFESVNKQSQALGTNMSQSVRSVVGEVRRLESSLSGLQSRLNRLTSTSSALGAANISGALGALTGQGRGFSGGGGYGGGGGGYRSGGPLSGGMFGGGGGLGATAARISRPVLKSLPFVGPFFANAAAGAGGIFDFFSGAMMGGMRQSYGARSAMERASRTMGGLSGVSNYGQFRAMGRRHGYSPFETHGLSGDFQSAIGNLYQTKFFPNLHFDGEHMRRSSGGRFLGGRGGYQTHAPLADFTGRAQGMGLDPRQALGLMSGLRGLGRNVSLAGAPSEAYYRHVRGSGAGYSPVEGVGGGAPALDLLQRLGGMTEVLMSRAGISGAAARGAERRYRNPRLLAGMASLVNMQMGTGVAAAGSMRDMGGMLGILQDRTRGGFDPQVANLLAQRLFQGSLNPGGGEAGNLLMMRAGGFGNPNIRGVQAQAARMGMDPSIIRRRNFLEYRRWRESNPGDRARAGLAQIAFDYRGNAGAASLALAETLGIGQTYADRLWAMGQRGEFGSGIDKLMKEALGARVPGKASGAGSTAITQTIAQYEQALLRVSNQIGGAVRAINNLQVKNLDSIAKGLGSVRREFNKLANDTTKIKELGEVYRGVATATVELMKAIIKAAPKESKRSDIRLKKNIVKVGVSDWGINIYEFEYKSKPGRFRGVMAQELVDTYPAALSVGQDGYYRVDYSVLDVPFEKVLSVSEAHL